jgi:predicted ATPase
MLNSIKLTNLLSFGAETEIILNPGLNVLIGANGSGKSNLIEAISLLQAMPKDLTKAIRDGGGIEEWLWKGEKNPVAKIEAVIQKNENIRENIRHKLNFQAENYRIQITSEFVEEEIVKRNFDVPYFYYKHDNKGAFINSRSSDEERNLKRESIQTNQSILAQFYDPEKYPEIFYLASNYQKIKFYREWQFGRNAESRKGQRADLPNDFLEENIINLALILNSLRQDREAKRKLLDALKLFHDSIEDFDIRIHPGGYVEIFFQESHFNSPIPASRLSDGTLRYLSLLAILLHPNPPPLICIEEPELGLHPDVLPTLIDLLKEAAQKTQIIITTHSADLIDDLSDMPESVLVFDKYQGSTSVSRLDKDELKDWLEDYRLGEMWRRGHFGGNRW